MANINSIYFNSPSKQLFVDNQSNQFVVSGYRLVVDPTLNRDLLLVNPPVSTGDLGVKGNIAFDNNHIYYCADSNKWLRAKLASWVLPGQESSLYATNAGPLPSPTHWWPFRGWGQPLPPTHGKEVINGSYNFDYGAPSFMMPAFSDGVTTDSSRNLLNFTSNLVQPSVVNESFSLSFEIKRANPNSIYPNQQGGFILGSMFGRLGFHVSYCNTASGKIGAFGARGAYEVTGSNIQFALGAHLSGTSNFSSGSYRWASVATTTALTDYNSFYQIVCTNDFATKTIKIYSNGQEEASFSYENLPLASKYNNPAHQGWGIGGNPNGSWAGANVRSTTNNQFLTLRNMGFWRGTALTPSQVAELYNGGTFKRYPFI